MNDNKSLIVIKENFFTRIINKIKKIFRRNKGKNIIENTMIEEKVMNDLRDNKKNEFFNSIKVQSDSGIIYLKIKLENNEIRAIDLTDEQIDQLQKIYDKEILEKQNKIKRLKGIA